jgi:hypothetical protein
MPVQGLFRTPFVAYLDGQQQPAGVGTRRVDRPEAGKRIPSSNLDAVPGFDEIEHVDGR